MAAADFDVVEIGLNGVQTLHRAGLPGSHPDRGREAALALVAARNAATGLDALPETLRPLDNESAWQIQTQVTQLLAERGDLVVGWKCASQVADKLIAAPIYRSLLFKTSGCDALRLMTSCEKWVDVEPELAVVLASDLPPRDQPYTAEDIAACIGAIHPGLEIIGSRYADATRRTFPELLADGLLNNGLVLADDVHINVDSPPPTLAIGVDVEGDVETRQGVHPEGEVLRPLYWLANFLRERGLGLGRGDAVITGSYAGVLRVPVGRRVVMTFGRLGSMQIRFDYNQR